MKINYFQKSKPSVPIQTLSNFGFSVESINVVYLLVFKFNEWIISVFF